jgi:hypothetical protein
MGNFKYIASFIIVSVFAAYAYKKNKETEVVVKEDKKEENNVEMIKINE